MALGVVAITGLDAAAVFTRRLGDVVVLAEELGVVVIVFAGTAWGCGILARAGTA